MGIRRPDFSRRVAVTGLGIISPIGQDIDTVWDNLSNGRSGLNEITRWDPTPYEAQDRGRSQRLRRHAVDGLQGHPPHRSQRGHGRRRRPSRRWPTPASRSRTTTATTSASSSAPAAAARTAHGQPREVGEQRRAHRQPVLHRQHAARHGVRPDRHRDRHPRLEHVHRHGLLDGHAQHRRGGRGHPPRRLHRRHHRRDREPAARDGPHRLLEHARHGPAAAGRGARDRFAAVRQDAQRLRPWRGHRAR